MTNLEFVETLMHIALKEKTLYVNGCYGKRLSEGQKQYYINHYAYNRGIFRKPKILAASTDTIGADCICIIKAVIDGWNSRIPGDECGVKYNPSHDLTEKGLLDACGASASDDFSKIEIGEFLYLSGHGGVYIGDGLAVEATPSWKDGVQITAVENIAKRSDYNGRKWSKHGKLPWIDYSTEYMKANVPVLQYGATGNAVKRLQTLLNLRCNAGLEVDGSFGNLTLNAVKQFQYDHLLDVDGSVGGATWGALLC